MTRLSTRGDAGFTLVELLVSLAILGLMASMLLGGLRTTGYYVARSQSRAQDDESIAAAQRILRGRLEQLRAVTRSDSSLPQVDAQGDEGTFTFFAPPLARAEPDALWRYRIVATATGDLMLYWANSLDDRFDFEERETVGWQPVKLLENVGAIRINYFGQDVRAPGRRWQARWSNRPQPPDLIRIRVTFPPESRKVWPDLIVRPRATVNTACKIDALSGRCEFAL